MTQDVRSCGVFVMRREPRPSFLLMRHADRWDLPKGHVDAGESDLQCALRELQEETGVLPVDIELDPHFEFVLQYPVREKRDPRHTVNKTLRIFLAWLRRELPIQPSEHLGFEWFAWQPPHRIQAMTIDPLLAAVAEYLAPKNGSEH